MEASVLVGRRAIFDQRFRVMGYELFRWREGSEEPEDLPVLVQSWLDLGLDRIAGAVRAYLPVRARLLAMNPEPFLALPATEAGLWLIGDAPAAPLRRAIETVRAKGLAVIYADPPRDLAPAVAECVDAMTFNWQKSDDALAVLRAIRPRLKRWIASHLDDHEALQSAQQAGAQGFQGTFFQKPERVRTRAVQANKLALLRAVQAAQRAQAPSDLAQWIRQDAALSWRLLRWINSPAVGLRAEVRSIEQALALLGLSAVRRWLMLLVIASLGEHKPQELLRVALVRARFLELLAQTIGDADAGDDFLLGLFSVLDALLDLPMEEALAELPLADEIKQGLLEPDSVGGRRLALARAVEQADWTEAYRLLHEGLQLPVMEAARLYHEALSWADGQMQVLSA